MKWTKPENWEQFGKIFDAVLNSGASINIDVLNPSSDDAWFTVAITKDAITKIEGGEEVAMGSFDLFEVMADAANKIEIKTLDTPAQTDTLFP